MNVKPADYFLSLTTAGETRPWSSFTIRRVNIIDLIRLTRIRDSLEQSDNPERRIALMIAFLKITLCRKGVSYLGKCSAITNKSVFRFGKTIASTDLEILFLKSYHFNIPQPDQDELKQYGKRQAVGESAKPIEDVAMELAAVSAAYWHTDLTAQLTGKNIFQLLAEEKMIRRLQAADSLRDLEVAAGAKDNPAELQKLLKSRAKGEEIMSLAEAMKRICEK